MFVTFLRNAQIKLDVVFKLFLLLLSYSKLEKDKNKVWLDRLSFGLLESPPPHRPVEEPQSVDHFFASEGVNILKSKRVYLPGASDHLGMEVHLKLDFETPVDDG